MERLKLGLIGDNIAASRSPLLHRLAGLQSGIDVTYERLVPRELGEEFEPLLAALPQRGYRGTNVTYPYKERAARLVRIDDPLVRAIGAVNTVLFEPDGPRGFNTDHSGFIAAYRRARGATPPGVTLLIGTGGVGRALAFALLALGAEALRLVDRDRAKAEALAEDLRKAQPELAVAVFDSAAEGAAGAAGLVNCTPLGMTGLPGTPLAEAAMRGADWAFDAVYTPVDTEFLQAAARQGLAVLSGWELFFFQGLQAWMLFSGLSPDSDALRRDLLAEA